MKNILIVDDDHDIRVFLAEELASVGYLTDQASDGVEAVLQVINGGYDLVLMDIRMPRLGGIGALHIIRRLAPHLPVIMFTGQAGTGDMGDSSRLGAFTCLLKPVNMEKLLNAIEQALCYGQIPSFQSITNDKKL